MKMQTVQHLLVNLNGFTTASAALTELFTPPFTPKWLRLVKALLWWQSVDATTWSLGQLLQKATSNDDDDGIHVTSDMMLLAMGKPVMMFATLLYDEELALSIWNGLLYVHQHCPQFSLVRQVLDHSYDSHGFSAMHYAIDAQMDTLFRLVIEYLTQHPTYRSLLERITTQDVVLPMSKNQIQGKNIASGGCNLLHFAVGKGELHMVKQLVEAPIAMNLESVNWDGYTPLQVAMIHGHHAIQTLLEEEEHAKTTHVAMDADNLRSERDETAKARYMASLEPQPPMTQAHVFTGIWTIDECDLVRQTLLHVTSTRGWDTQRHASYPTTDIPCYCVVPIDSWVRNSICRRLFPQIHATYAIPTTQMLTFRELFYVKYEARQGERAELGLHCDGSVLSFNILLNPADAFQGGGTFFEATNSTIHITQGDAVVHSGKVRHAGAPVVDGVRLILVGFLDLVDNVWDARR